MTTARRYYSSNAVYEGAESLYWQDYAECRGTDISWFFSGGNTTGHKGDNESKLPGKYLCQDCVVRLQCLNYAIKNQEPYGVWGGLTTRERRKLARAYDN